MDKRLPASLLIILSAVYASALEDSCHLIEKYPRTVHLGNDETYKKFVPLWPEKYSYKNNFTIKAPVEKANLSFDVYETHVGNRILLNNRLANKTCIHVNETWKNCVVQISDELFVLGLNTLEFISDKRVKYGTNRDDFMIKKIILHVTYKHCSPRIVVTKTYHPINPSVGDEVNVTVLFTNIGILPAINVSFMEKPVKLGLIDGSTNGSVDTLLRNNVFRLRYTLNASRPGRFTTEEGVVSYHDKFGNYNTTAIPSMTLDIKPVAPKLIIVKNSSSPIVYQNDETEITVNIINAGGTDAFNISVTDHLAENLNIVDGSPNFTIQKLKAFENTTHTYSITANGSSLFFSAAYMTYQDSVGNTYNKTSNYIELTAKLSPNPTGSRTSSLRTILLVLVIGIIILSVIFLMLRGR
jgi:uncharacterized repeat protein (TIGR01451 family)